MVVADWGRGLSITSVRTQTLVAQLVPFVDHSKYVLGFSGHWVEIALGHKRPRVHLDIATGLTLPSSSTHERGRARADKRFGTDPDSVVIRRSKVKWVPEYPIFLSIKRFHAKRQRNASRQAGRAAITLPTYHRRDLPAHSAPSTAARGGAR